MNISPPLERSQQAHEDSNNTSTDRQVSPASTSRSFPETATSDVGYVSPQGQREDALGTKSETLAGSKIKKKLSELDIRGAMADLDLRKGGKRHGIEDFYIQLDEP